MLSRHPHVRGGLVTLGLLVLLVGCGPNYKARATVKGKVTFGGKALTVGSIMFHGKNNLTGGATIDKDGNYVMNDAPIGDVTITVTVPKQPQGGIARMKIGPGAGPGGKDGKDSKSVDPTDSSKTISIMSAMPTNVVAIPEKFGEVATSGLTYTVVKGEQTHDIVMKP